MAKLNFPDPNVTQTYIEAGITWTWNSTLGVWSSDSISADADDLYLSKVSDDTAAGAITFEGTTTHNSGITVESGSNQNNIYKAANGNLVIKNKLGAGTGGAAISIGTKGNAGANAYALTMSVPTYEDSREIFGIQVNAENSNVYAGSDGLLKNIHSQGSNIGNYAEAALFSTQLDVSANAAPLTYGYYSNCLINNDLSKKVYNFYAAGDAPSYFRGLTEHASGLLTNSIVSDNGATPSTDITIGNGDAAAVSINNYGSVTGGSQGQSLIVTYSGTHDHTKPFYNIRSGISTPASSTQDIFSISGTASSQNTSGVLAAVVADMNLAANTGTGAVYSFYALNNAPSYFAGLTEHAGGVKVTGGRDADVETGIYYDGSGRLNFKNNGTKFTVTDNTASTFSFTSRSIVDGSDSATLAFFNHNSSNSYTKPLINIHSRFGGTQGAPTTTDRASCFQATVDTAGMSTGGPLVGYYTNMSNSDQLGTGGVYGFYAEGTAPNYLQGELEVRANTTGANAFIKCKNYNANIPQLIVSKQGGINGISAIEVQADGATQWSVAYNGTASFRSMTGELSDVQVQMDADNPAAFTTTFTTEEDADGNEVQVESTTYSGTTESLLDIIRDLRARVATLESNTLQPLYSTLADLPDASEHHGKTAHVHSEGALYFAHAGSWVKLQNA